MAMTVMGMVVIVLVVVRGDGYGDGSRDNCDGDASSNDGEYSGAGFSVIFVTGFGFDSLLYT